MKGKTQQDTEDLEQDLKTAPITDDCDDLLPRAYVANNKSLKYLDELDRLASSLSDLEIHLESTCSGRSTP